MMADLTHSTDSNNKQISSSVISCDLPKHILAMITYPSEKWFTENNYCSVEDWESWLPFAIEECIINEFTLTVNPKIVMSSSQLLTKLLPCLLFNDEKFLSNNHKGYYCNCNKIVARTRVARPHIEDSYTMQDYRNEKALFVKKISDLLKGGI